MGKRPVPKKGTRRLDALEVWAEIEEQFPHRFETLPTDRLVYFYLVRQSRLQGERKLKVTWRRLGSALRFSPGTVRSAMQRLRDASAVRVRAFRQDGLVVEVRLPSEIRGQHQMEGWLARTVVRTADFYNNPRLRSTIFDREKKRCFYCGRRLQGWNATLDHVRPQAYGKDHSWNNVVACCWECNGRKGRRTAEEFLRQLEREGRLTAEEHQKRRKALEELRRSPGP